jgi:hypothetical protein
MSLSGLAGILKMSPPTHLDIFARDGRLSTVLPRVAALGGFFCFVWPLPWSSFNAGGGALNGEGTKAGE